MGLEDKILLEKWTPMLLLHKKNYTSIKYVRIEVTGLTSFSAIFYQYIKLCIFINDLYAWSVILVWGVSSLRLPCWRWASIPHQDTLCEHIFHANCSVVLTFEHQNVWKATVSDIIVMTAREFKGNNSLPYFEQMLFSITSSLNSSS